MSIIKFRKIGHWDIEIFNQNFKYLDELLTEDICPTPVGAFFITHSNENPANKWIGTTWEEIPYNKYISSNPYSTLDGRNSITLIMANLPVYTHSLSSTENGSHNHSFITNSEKHFHYWNSVADGNHNHYFGEGTVALRQNGAHHSHLGNGDNSNDYVFHQEYYNEIHTHKFTINATGGHTHNIDTNLVSSHRHNLRLSKPDEVTWGVPYQHNPIGINSRFYLRRT